ncbi:MAG TPA: DinB family protein [Longimicrobiaceae bacterium]|nr:DinB family protein [Longimicrobiaceae bacterium]
MTDLTRAFIEESRRHLSRDFLPKIREAVEPLSEADVWWKPNPVSNSVGNLLLHLSGNLGQWVGSALGDRPDERRRDREFDPAETPDKATLLARLNASVAEADEVLASLDPAVLSERRTIQAREVTGFEALYHAVEHFSMHTGQILYIAKLRTGRDLRFYEMVDGVPKAKWGR